MLASGLAMVTLLDAGCSRGISSMPAFTGVPPAMLLKAAPVPPRSSAAPLPATNGRIRPRFTSPIFAASSSLFHGQRHHQQQEEAEQSDDDDRNHCRPRHSRSTALYCCTRRGDHSTRRQSRNIPRRSNNSPSSPPPCSWSTGGRSSFREVTSLGVGSAGSDGWTSRRSSAGGVGLGGGGGGDCTHRSPSGIGGVGVNGATVVRRRQRQSLRLLAAGRGEEGEARQRHQDEGDEQEAEQEAEQEERARARPRSREEAFYGSSIPVSKRGPPEEDDMWSKHSVFEFKSLNDPDTNASCYKGLSGQPGGPSAAQRASQSRPGPDKRLTSRARPAFDEELEVQRSRGSEAEENANDLFKFREKEALARTRAEVERARRSAGGATVSNTAVRVELATQLGLPATATYDELRAAYRVEVKRCHPDMAGDNEFRVKLLERRFQRLRSSWDSFVEEQTAASSGRSSRTEASTGNPKANAARERARARAQAEERAQQEAVAAATAAAAAQRRGRRVMDPGRQIFDAGGPSC